jgi:hypothetical protein
VELLAGRETGEHHLDVLVGLEAREADHLAREVGDAHGLAHLEDEDLATATRARGLQDQLHGFGNGHEVARRRLTSSRKQMLHGTRRRSLPGPEATQ